MIRFPNGAKAALAILKFAMPKDIPIMVQHKTMPVIKCPMNNHIPQNITPKKFIKPEPATAFSPTVLASTNFFPNGKKANDAIRKQAIPKGIPIMVAQQIIPESSQAHPNKIPPPKTNHNTFPIKDIVFPFCSFVNHNIVYCETLL